MPDQFSLLARMAIDSQLSGLKAVTEATFHCLGKLNRLNTSLVTTSSQEANVILQAMLKAERAGEVTSLCAAQIKPGAQKILGYGRHISTISSGLQMELQEAAKQQLAATERTLAQITASGDMQAGQIQALRAILAAMVNAGHGVDQMNEVVRQATSATKAVMDDAVQRWRDIAPEALPADTSEGTTPPAGPATSAHRWH